MPSLNEGPLHGQRYWRSLDELADTPEFREFMHHEFPAGAADMLDSAGRRDFLKIMAASMALAGLGLGGCRRWPREEIAPFANRPVGRMPGVPVQYATSFAMAGAASPLLALSMDGRPIKLDGNPDHPISGTGPGLGSGATADERRAALRGGSTTFAQASILDLYDPDRSRDVTHAGEASTWAEFVDENAKGFKAVMGRRGSGLAILCEADASPTLAAMRDRLLEKAPNAKWIEYEPLTNDNVIAGSEMAFGVPHRPQHDLTKADIIVSLDADFMFDDPAAVKLIRDFAAGRRLDGPEDSMSRLYCFESAMTLTGSNADNRVSMRSGDVAIVAAWIAAKALDEPALQQLIERQDAAAVLTGDTLATLEHLWADLQSHRGKSVLMAGPRQPAEVHALCHLVNNALGNAGQTVRYTADPQARPHARGIAELAAAIDSGNVRTLIIIGANPVYTAPADLDFAGLLGKIRLTVHLGDYLDETAVACQWHLNRAHYLESWGDTRSADGTVSIVQPMIRPLFNGHSAIELLAVINGDEVTDGQELVKRNFQEMTGSDDGERRWRKTLHDGLLRGSALSRETPSVKREARAAVAAGLARVWEATNREGLEVVYVPDYSVYDGRFANNGWLQELPDPLTKLTWDNAVLIGVATAERLDISTGDRVRITVEKDRSVEAAAMVIPGQAEDSVTLPLGYGRRFPGRVSTGAGFDFYPLRSSSAVGFTGGATVQGVGGTYELATTQDHHTIDVETTGGRSIQKRLPSLVREATLDEYRHHPNFTEHRAHVTHRLSLWDDQERLQDARYAWAMSIDLSSCVGCNSCVVACQAENNIPIVGKDQVLRGREMHWIRVDRYFRFEQHDGHYDATKVSGVTVQPVACMHCENAACEQVCPVAATVHDEDGLNVMVYNRCIGTRYCSNNCPFKVRRFNYFDFHRRDPHREQPGTLLQVEPSYYTREQAASDPLQQMQFNPEVSVRVRGVMEKCTYCVQRITAARIDAKNEWVGLDTDDPARQDERVPIADGTIQTACEQACPAGAIVFGDLRDPKSRVSSLHQSDRSYEMLEELNPRPRTQYLARITNPAGDTGGGEGGGH